MDLCLYAKNNGIHAETVADQVDLTPAQVQGVYDDIDVKRSTTRYLHLPPLLVDDVPEISMKA
jgi:NAD+ synthase